MFFSDFISESIQIQNSKQVVLEISVTRWSAATLKPLREEVKKIDSLVTEALVRGWTASEQQANVNVLEAEQIDELKDLRLLGRSLKRQVLSVKITFRWYSYFKRLFSVYKNQNYKIKFLTGVLCIYIRC